MRRKPLAIRPAYDPTKVYLYGEFMPITHVESICKAVMLDYTARPDIYADENWRNDPLYNARKPKCRNMRR